MVDTKKTNAEIAIEWLKQFDEDQIEQIMWGLSSGVDVILYAKPELNWVQMRRIRLEQEGRADELLDNKPGYLRQKVWEMLLKLEQEKKDDVE